MLKGIVDFCSLLGIQIEFEANLHVLRSRRSAPNRVVELKRFQVKRIPLAIDDKFNLYLCDQIMYFVAQIFRVGCI